MQVDAALDLSHTQNIGRMIRQHFPYSQFVVVSLKEGMFNNANVIFRTKFLDGVSTVTRTSHNARSASNPWDIYESQGLAAFFQASITWAIELKLMSAVLSPQQASHVALHAAYSLWQPKHLHAACVSGEAHALGCSLTIISALTLSFQMVASEHPWWRLFMSCI